MALNETEKALFHALETAVKRGNLVLVETRYRLTGERCAALATMFVDGDDVVLYPIGILRDGIASSLEPLDPGDTKMDMELPA